MEGRKNIPNGGNGRPPGTLNKSTKAIKDAFHEAFFKRGGVAALLKWAEKNETEFYKLAARLIPVQVKGTINHQVSAQELSDDELAAIVRREQKPALPHHDTQH